MLAERPNVPLGPRDATEIRRILRPFLEPFQGRLILFGSRARGDARSASDIDLAVRAAGPLPSWILARMRDALEESGLPFRVDLVGYAGVSEELKRAIDEEGVAWPR